MSENVLYKDVLSLGVALQYKSLCLSDLRQFNVNSLKDRKYQVHQDGKFSQIYDSLDDAVSKFIELKNKI